MSRVRIRTGTQVERVEDVALVSVHRHEAASFCKERDIHKDVRVRRGISGI